MRLLIDENLSPRVADFLNSNGIDALHVLGHGLGGACDEDIAAWAVAHDRIVVSADSDFATLLALNGSLTPSLVLLRSGDRLAPGDQAALLLSNLPALADDLRRGAVVSLSGHHVRVRALPLV